MRSRQQRRRRSSAIGLMLLSVVALGASGCQLNRTFFQMDSNSPVPFFGVDLTPRWPQKKSSVDGVSRLQSESIAADSSSEKSAQTPKSSPAKTLTLPTADVASHEPDTTIETAPTELFR